MATIVSGIQPSGKLHVGNYLGAVRQWLEFQKDASNQCYFFLADWHSLTEQYDAATKAAQVRELAVELLALGIDPQRVVLFRQSDLLEHLELAWYLTCVTPVAEMERMTQYKDKTARGHSPNTGLFTYPILMAADILAYSSKPEAGSQKLEALAVPVGHDQLQHVELTNDIVRWFNNRYGETFVPVKPILTMAARVMSLKDPAKKMSKSLGGDHCLFLDDSVGEVERKIRGAVTDTGSGPPHSSRLTTHDSDSMSPGAQTLFALLDAFGTREDYEKFRKAHESGILKYSELKPAVTTAFAEYFAEFRSKKAKLLANPETIDAALAHGAIAARAAVSETLSRVRKMVGIR